MLLSCIHAKFNDMFIFTQLTTGVIMACKANFTNDTDILNGSSVLPHWHFLNYFTQKEWTSINLFSSKICKLINEPENLWQILDICLQVLLQLKITEDIINRKKNINYSTKAVMMEQIKPPFGNSRKFLNVSSKMCWIHSHFVEGRDISNLDITDRKTNYCQSLQNMISWCIRMIQDPLCSN